MLRIYSGYWRGDYLRLIGQMGDIESSLCNGVAINKSAGIYLPIERGKSEYRLTPMSRICHRFRVNPLNLA